MKKLSFFLMALLVSLTSIAAEVTFTAGTDVAGTSTGVANATLEKGGITLVASEGTWGRTDNYRVYASKTLTVSSSVGNIKSVVFTCTGNGTSTNGPGKFSGEGYTASDGKTGTWTGDATEFQLTTSAQVRITSILVTYEATDSNATIYEVAAEECTVGAGYGTVTGGGNKVEGATVTLTAKPNPGYVFDSWDNGSKDNPLTLTVTGNIYQCASFIPQTPITIAEALALADGTTGVLNYFTVSYVNGPNIYIQDESGYALAFKYDYGLKAGDGVNFMAFTRSTHNDIPQLTPATDYAKLTIIPGEAPAIAEITSAPTVADNRLVKLMNVSLAGDLTAKGVTVATCADGSSINIYSTIAYTVEEGKTYNIIGGVTQYSGNIQIQAYEVEEVVVPVVNYNIYLTASPAEGGEVENEGEFEEGEQITVSALANEGYEFVCWTEGVDTVSKDANYSFTVTAERNLVANFQRISETVYFINNENWEGDIYAYAWKGENGEEKNAEWPGVLATKLETPYEGFENYDAYSYTALYGQYDYVIFTNNQGQQTINHPWVGNAFYYIQQGPAMGEMWTVAGTPIFGTTWNETDANNDMRLQDNGSYLWEKTGVELAAGNKIEFKVVKDHNWDAEAYPSSNYELPITESAIYTITITFDAATKEITATATKTGDSDIVATYKYVLMGIGGDWDNGITMTPDPTTTTNTYALTQQEILTNAAVKVVTIIDGVKSNYCGNIDESSTVPYSIDGLGNIVLEPGIYDFYYKVNEDLIFITGKVYPKPATLVLSMNGTESTLEGEHYMFDVVTLPAKIDNDCLKQFVGWSADANCVTEPEYAPGAEYTLTESTQTLYAVYATGHGGENTSIILISDYAVANSWVNGTKYLTVTSGDITATAAGGNNTGKFYTNGNNWRLYQNENPTLTISTTVGELQSIKFGFTVDKTGTLLYDGNVLANETAIEVTGTSATFNVGNSNPDINNGQIRIAAIEVVYSSAPTYSDYSTTCASTLDAPIFSLQEGEYTEAQNVLIDAPVGTIYYTLDGTLPTAESTVYTEAIVLDKCGATTIKAIAISGEAQSEVVSATYTIKLPLDNSQENPYTEQEAIDVYNGDCYNDQYVYVTGVVKTAKLYSSGSYTITLEGGFQFYMFYEAAGETKFTEDYITAGDTLVACGKLGKHNTTYQLAAGCYLVERKAYSVPKVDISNTQATAYTVEEAWELIDDINSDLSKEVYVKGIVSEIVEAFSAQYGNITYNISTDGTTDSDQLKVYRGKSFNGEKFTSADDIKVGDKVVVYGKLTKYNNTSYQVDSGSALVDRQREGGDATALDNAVVAGKTTKMVINGQLIIVKDGVKYNAQGAKL